MQFGKGPYNSGNYGRPENGGRENPVYATKTTEMTTDIKKTAITGSRAWSGSEVNGNIMLDVDSISVAGRRYRVSTSDEELQNRRDGVGGNARTGKYVGGGKGAAIGAATQIITRGKEVRVPAESVIRFRLDRPLRLRLWS